MLAHRRFKEDSGEQKTEMISGPCTGTDFALLYDNPAYFRQARVIGFEPISLRKFAQCTSKSTSLVRIKD